MKEAICRNTRKKMIYRLNMRKVLEEVFRNLKFPSRASPHLNFLDSNQKPAPSIRHCYFNPRLKCVVRLRVIPYRIIWTSDQPKNEPKLNYQGYILNIFGLSMMDELSFIYVGSNPWIIILKSRDTAVLDLILVFLSRAPQDDDVLAVLDIWGPRSRIPNPGRRGLWRSTLILCWIRKIIWSTKSSRWPTALNSKYHRIKYLIKSV